MCVLERSCQKQDDVFNAARMEAGRSGRKFPQNTDFKEDSGNARRGERTECT